MNNRQQLKENILQMIKELRDNLDSMREEVQEIKQDVPDADIVALAPHIEKMHNALLLFKDSPNSLKLEAQNVEVDLDESKEEQEEKEEKEEKVIQEIPSPDLSKTKLLAGAFAPVYFKTIEKDTLIKFYSGEDPYYAGDAPGTRDNEEAFSAEDQAKIDNYNKQLSILVEAVEKKREELSLTNLQIDNLKAFQNRISSRRFYVKQTALFYSEIKQDLEKIVLGLSDPSLTKKAKQEIIHDLLDEIISCGPGIFKHIKKASSFFSNEDTIEYWLANFRDVIIQQFSENHLKKKNLSSENINHVINVFSLYARDQHWNPLGFDRLHAVNEIHARIAKVEENDYNLLVENFFKNYNPVSVMKCIAETLHARIVEKIKKDPAVILEDIEQYNNFFKGLPLIKYETSLFVIYDEELYKENNQNFYIHYPPYVLELRSPQELRLSLTKLFIEKLNNNLFQGYSFNLKKELGESFKLLNNNLLEEVDNLTVGLVPESSDICYIADADKIFQLNQTQSVISLAIFQDMGISLTPISFAGYLQQGVTDFSNCLLDNVDLRGINNFENLNFTNTRFENIKASPSQFISLYDKKCYMTFNHFSLDEESSADIERCISQSEDNKSKLLFYAIITRATSLIATLIREGASPAIKGISYYRGDAPSMFAFEDTVKPADQPPIAIAAYAHYWDCVKVFAQTVSDTDTGSYHFGSALLTAAQYNQIDIVKALLAAKAELTWHTLLDKNNALHHAAKNNNPEMIEILLKAGANAAAVNEAGQTPIAIAADARYWDCVKVFAQTVSDTDIGSYQFGRALLRAAKYNQIDIVKALLAAKAELTWQTLPDKNTALHYAAKNNNPEMVEILLKAGANAAAVNEAGQAPIAIAADARYWDCVKVFAQTVSDTDTGSYQFGKALVVAAQHNQIDVVKILLTAKAVLTWHTLPDKNTALHHAAKNNNPEMVEILLKAGANAAAVNEAGQTPIAIAAYASYWDCVKVFAQTVSDTDTGSYQFGGALVVAAQHNQIDLVKILLAAKAQLTWHTLLDKNTALHHAAKNNNPEMIEILLKAGANVAAVNEEDKTPIEIVLAGENLESVPKLFYAAAEKQDIANFQRLLNKISTTTIMTLRDAKLLSLGNLQKISKTRNMPLLAMIIIKLINDNVDPKKFKKYKNEVKNYIVNLNDPVQKQRLLQAVFPMGQDTPLSLFFNSQRGVLKPSVKRGTLKELSDELKRQNRT